MDKELKYITDELIHLTEIASPTGFTKKAEQYVIKTLKDMGYSGYINIEMSAWTLSPDQYEREQFGRKILYLGQRLAAMTE